MLAPLLSEAWQAGRPEELAKLVHQATVKVTIPTAALGTAMAIFTPQFLHLFGPDFVQATPALRILILAALINAATGPADIALNMCGFQRPAMRASAKALATSFALLLLGVATGSVNNIAMAVLFATAIRKAMFWRLALKHLSIRTDVFAAMPNSTPKPSASRT